MNNLKRKLQEERKKFKPYEGEKAKELHIRLTKSMLTHPNYISLSCTARTLYNYMKLWAYGSNEFKNHGTFDYSVSLAIKYCNCSNKTIIKAFKELQDGGFIERMNNSRYSRCTSKWMFSDKWYTGGNI